MNLIISRLIVVCLAGIVFVASQVPVAFVGQSLISVSSDRSFAGSLVNSVARYTLEEMKQFPKTGRVLQKSR